MSRPIYLDYNATTPVAQEVAAAMLPFLHAEFGNPSSSHAHDVKAQGSVVAVQVSVCGWGQGQVGIRQHQRRILVADDSDERQRGNNRAVDEQGTIGGGHGLEHTAMRFPAA